MHVGHRELVECLEESVSPGEVTMQRRAADADGRGDLVLGRVGPPAEEVRGGAQHLFTIQLHETTLSQLRQLCIYNWTTKPLTHCRSWWTPKATILFTSKNNQRIDDEVDDYTFGYPALLAAGRIVA
jgi:hypothetical protein